MNRFDGTDFTENEIKNAIQNVVDNYNNGVIKGTFYLQKSTNEYSGYSNVKSYTLTYGNSNGGGNGGGYTNPLDFEFSYGFQDFTGNYAYFDEDNGTYSRATFLHVGVQSGLYSRDITEFAIGIQCLDGSISYKNGWNDDFYVTKKGNIIWYAGRIRSDEEYQWSTLLFFNNLHTPDIQFKWTYRVKLNGVYELEGEHWHNEVFPGILP